MGVWSLTRNLSAHCDITSTHCLKSRASARVKGEPAREPCCCYKTVDCIIMKRPHLPQSMQKKKRSENVYATRGLHRLVVNRLTASRRNIEKANRVLLGKHFLSFSLCVSSRLSRAALLNTEGYAANSLSNQLQDLSD